MNLASRLSTAVSAVHHSFLKREKYCQWLRITLILQHSEHVQSNMGLLDTPATRNAFILGNLALLQLQSLTVGSVAGLFSFALGMVVHPTVNNLEEIALMISSSMLCASMSSLILGSFMCVLVLVCRHYRVNPGKQRNNFLSL